MKILITGVSGFVAPHLVRYIQSLNEGHEIYGAIRNRSVTVNLPKEVKLVECELKDTANVNEMISVIMPDVIFHLAAQSFVHTSWKSPADTLINNIIGELNILEAVRGFSPNTVIHIAGSSEEYGEPITTPIFESHELNPLSPYGVSKVAQEKLAYQYWKSYGIKTVLTRAFNHTGPGRDARFAEASFAKQVADPSVKEIHVGNLGAIRDYTDVRDMVRAYWMAANSGCYGTPLNICTGKGTLIGDVLSRLIAISGRTDLAIKQDPERMRPSDLKVLVGNSDKFRHLTGWEPQVEIDKTLKDLYENFTDS